MGVPRLSRRLSRSPRPCVLIYTTIKSDSDFLKTLKTYVLCAGKEKLQIAQLRPIDRRVVDLCKDAAPDREPNPASKGMGCANAILGGSGP